jgi:hypothetical protein
MNIRATVTGEKIETFEPPRPLTATPWVWRDPKMISPREFLYGKHYIRKFVSAGFGAPGGGKSSKRLVEALAMASGRVLLGVKPVEKLKVWYWNGEDSQMADTQESRAKATDPVRARNEALARPGAYKTNSAAAYTPAGVIKALQACPTSSAALNRRTEMTDIFLGQMQSSMGERIEVWLRYLTIELRIVDASGQPIKRMMDRLTFGVDDVDTRSSRDAPGS